MFDHIGCLRFSNFEIFMSLQLIFVFFIIFKILIFSSKVKHLLLSFLFFLPTIDAIAINCNKTRFLPCFA